jgi:CrcB protein
VSDAAVPAEAPAAPRAGGARPRHLLLDPRAIAAVFAGGVVGTLARAGLAEAAPPTPGHWPWATFAANVAGAFVLGLIATHHGQRPLLSIYRRPLLGTGFCGALTTFSTMQLELLRMLDAGRLGLAALYALGSIVAGYGGVIAATILIRRSGAATTGPHPRGSARR